MNPQTSTLNFQTSTLNTQPSTLNHQPSTLNPSTLNTQHSTLNPQPSTLNPQPSTLQQVMKLRDEFELLSRKGVHLENGPSQGHNLAVTVLCVPNSLGSGNPVSAFGTHKTVKASLWPWLEPFSRGDQGMVLRRGSPNRLWF